MRVIANSGEPLTVDLLVRFLSRANGSKIVEMKNSDWHVDAYRAVEDNSGNITLYGAQYVED